MPRRSADTDALPSRRPSSDHDWVIGPGPIHYGARRDMDLRGNGKIAREAEDSEPEPPAPSPMEIQPSGDDLHGFSSFWGTRLTAKLASAPLLPLNLGWYLVLLITALSFISDRIWARMRATGTAFAIKGVLTKPRVNHTNCGRQEAHSLCKTGEPVLRVGVTHSA